MALFLAGLIAKFRAPRLQRTTEVNRTTLSKHPSGGYGGVFCNTAASIFLALPYWLSVLDHCVSSIIIISRLWYSYWARRSHICAYPHYFSLLNLFSSLQASSLPSFLHSIPLFPRHIFLCVHTRIVIVLHLPIVPFTSSLPVFLVGYICGLCLSSFLSFFLLVNHLLVTQPMSFPYLGTSRIVSDLSQVFTNSLRARAQILCLILLTDLRNLYGSLRRRWK